MVEEQRRERLCWMLWSSSPMDFPKYKSSAGYSCNTIAIVILGQLFKPRSLSSALTLRTLSKYKCYTQQLYLMSTRQPVEFSSL